MELSNETLKMARIAGIEAADATDAMTSALRGFNMELNQTSAQRVNDVYSELAAITASNVEELSTAMSKTASIAHSVNMEFETTAAFLAQGIETTRESAETIGTMLKTVIGRFSEVKSLYSKGEIKGTDESGEEINVNKVQKALRAAGVDMTKFFTGEEGLDQVFLNLSKKWDSLDITTQRYIATLAAGSRQQSRFLAIISDYSKTMELVNAANNSAGASQEQYEKTLDSLASKLAKLKNAWDEFAMGLANNEVIKVVVDTLTVLLQTINKILDTVSGGSGVLKSTLSILTAIGALKLGKSLLFTGIGKMVDGREGGLAGRWFGKKKEQQNTGYSAGIQTGRGFINGFESITKTFKSKGGKGFVQSIFSSKITPTDLSKVLNLDEWNLDFSNVDTKKAATFIASDLNKQISSHPELESTLNNMFNNTEASSNIELYRQELGKLNLQMEMTGQQAQDMGISVYRTVPNFQAMAIASGAAAAALMGLASLIEPLGEGGEDIAVILRGLAGTMMGLIPIISMVQTAMIAGAQSVSVAIKNIPIIGWIAAIISAVISLIQVISHFVKKNSTEEKTKDLIEATQAATEAAKEAKQAYDDLLSSKSKYTETQEALKKLVAGTDEWRQSLFSANQQVLDLISHYPMLQDFLTIGENGVLSIDEVGWRALTDSSQKNMIATQQASFAAQARQIEFQDVTIPTENERSKFTPEKELNMDALFELIQKEDNLDNFFEQQQMTVSDFASKFEDMDEELRNLILKKYGLENISAKDLQTLAESPNAQSLAEAFGLTSSDMNITYYSKEAMQALDEFGDMTYDTVIKIKELGNAGLSTAISIDKAKLKIENNLKQSALAGLSNKALQMEGETGFASFLSKQSAENYQEDFDKRSEELSKKGGIQTFAKNNKLDEKYGLTLTGDNEKDAAALYEALYKEEVPDGKDLDWMIEKITDKTLIDDLTNGIENLTARYENADKETQDFVKGIASNGQKMTDSQLKLADTPEEVEEKLKDTATKLGYGEDEIDKFISDIGYDGLTLAEVSKKIADQFAKTSYNFDNALTESKAKVRSVEGSGDILTTASTLMGGQTYEVYSNYLDQIVGLMIRGGADAANGFQTAFSEILNSSGADRQKIIELMSNYDLSNYDDVKAFIEELEKIVPATEKSEGQLEQLETALINLGKATKKVDLKSAISNLTESLNLADEIESRDKSEGITQEELEKIVASGARNYSDFIFTGQEFVPVQDSMSDLANAIRDNTDEVIKNTLALLEESIAKGEQIEQRVNNEENWTEVDLETKNRILSGEASDADVETIKEVFGFENSDTAEALERYRTYITDYLNLADNRAQEDAYKDFLAQSQAFQLDPQEQLDQGGAYLKERVEAQGLSNLQKEITEDFQESNSAIKANTKLIEAHTLRYAQAEKKVKTFCETIKDVKEAFDAGTKALKNNEKPSEDYYKALEKIAERGKQVFGESFTKEFVEENADLISQLSEGGEIGEQAFISLQQKISESVKKSLTDLLGLEAETSQIKSILGELDGVNAQFAINGTADVSQLMNSLIAAGQTAEEAAKTIEALTGSTVTFTVEKQVITVPAGQVYNANGKYAGAKVLGGMSGFVSIEIPKAIATKSTYSGSGFSSGSSGGSSGGSSSKEKVWENPYDKLYNLTEEINEALRRREALEREYDRILERRGSTFKEIRANYNAQLSSLEHELKLQKQLQAGRKEQLDAIANEHYTDSEGNRKTFAQTGATRYAQYDQNLNRIIIDWNAIDMVTDDDLGSAVEAYVSRLEELQDQFEEVDKTVEDMQDTINELKKSQMQDYLDFEQSVYDAIVNAQQKLIDEYQSLSDSIADSNSKILDNLQESIDLERQIRDNTKTEEDINEKEARLAFLRRDTSNANALEIKQLEEELSDARQDYSDSLIDQQLDRLSKQNDDAQEAREKQIELMQAQLDYASENGEFWNQAYELINDGFSSDGSLNQASQLWDLLKADQGWNGLSKFGQLNWQEEISKAIIAASQGYANWNMYKAEQVDKSLVLPDGTQLTYDGTNWKDSQGNVYKDVDFNSNKNQFEYGSIDYVKPTPTPETGGSGSSSEPEKKEISIGSSFNASGAPIYSYPGSSAQRQYFANDPYYVAIGEMGDYWMARWHGASSGVTGFFKKSDVRAYKTGGLADFTGPAWLDGSKTKPELVLNARDTENFLLLKDVLGSFLKNNTTTQNGKGGDNYYDIDISVDEIGSDYDVDQLARRIKEQITEDSTYRNVNAINFIR